MKPGVIVALDVDMQAQALALVDRLGPSADFYKVGIQTLTAVGPQLVRALTAQGKHVFLDLKLHEIPASVAGAVRVAGELGVSMVTVHASGGSAVLGAAMQAAAAFPPLQVLGLTVITSLADRDLPEIGLAPSVEAQVGRLASLASSAGCHGVVAFVHEAGYLRSRLPPGSLIVCPGIQLSDSKSTDQVRVATPGAAARAGATHIVVGRAIAAAADPLAAFQRVVSEFSMPSNVLSAIPRFIELNDTLATAGQPSQQQLADIAAAGFAVVINLGLLDPAYALEDEAGAVRALGMEYVHIPVEFSSPGLDDLARFSAAMGAAQGKKVFVHCRHNKRVPVFIALDRILRQGWAREAALADLRQAWVPDETWDAFIAKALSQ
jgi:orotidine-5'-phosphate decarboxylase